MGSSPLAKRPRAPRYLTLDAWRGVACLLIVVYHSALPYGLDESGLATSGLLLRGIFSVTHWMVGGVPMFFVISGYCIAATSDACRRGGRPIHQYFLRRFRRIFPPYWIACALILGISIIVGALVTRASNSLLFVPHLSVIQWIGNATLTEVWRGHVVGGLANKWFLGPAWTLCYEEQFYAVCGALLFVMPRFFFVGAGLVTVVTLLVAPFSFKHVGLSPRGFFFDGSWLIFAVGMLIYVSVNYAGRTVRKVLSVLLILGAVGAVVLKCAILPSLMIGADEQFLASQFVIGSAFGCVLIGLHRWDSLIATRAWIRPVAYCGQMCYSMYLIHMPVVLLVRATLRQARIETFGRNLAIAVPIATIATIVISRGFYLIVERRFVNPSLVPRRKGSAVVSQKPPRDHSV